MSRNNSVISIEGSLHDRNNRVVTAKSLKGRNEAFDFALKQTKADSNPERLRALHALATTGNPEYSGRRDSNASIMSTDSTYEAEPWGDGKNLRVSRKHVSKGRRASAAEININTPLRRPTLADFRWSGNSQTTVDENGNITKTIDTSIIVPNVFAKPGKPGLSMGGAYDAKGKLSQTTHTKSRRRVCQELAEAKAKKDSPSTAVGKSRG